MKTRILLLAFMVSILSVSCISTKSTIKNIDDNAPDLVLTKNNVFQISEYSKDKKYGYHKDYPINIYYKSTKNDSINQPRFFDALSGPNGEKIFYKKLENCCPFPSKKSEFGAALLQVYEVKWLGQKKPVKLYVNIYEKSVLMVPVGFTLKQF